MSNDRRAFRTADGREYVIGQVNGRMQFVMKQPDEPQARQASLFATPKKVEGVRADPPSFKGKTVDLARATMTRVFK